MTQTRARAFVVFTLLALAVPVAVFAAKPVVDTTPATISQASVSATAVSWQASGTYERVIVTVSGPEGFALSREFPAGTQPSLRVVDLGKNVVDGNYSWEARVVQRIPADVKRKLQQAREAGADELAAQIQAQAGLNRPISESGHFAVENGQFLASGAEAMAAGKGKVVATGLAPKPLDQVYPDDVIVQGSLCVGLDCVNNESFGFDTIRMKENNTRIKFDDTSTTAGCPANDWQLTANDACGGSSKFSIEDITGAKVPFTVTAGASTNSIFVDSTGRVGFRTSTPVLDLHVATSNTPAIRLEQNNSGGFTAQTWDIGANEANFFIRDVTGGSKLSLRIRPGAPTSSLDIAADGDVGIGTASPDQKLHVQKNDNSQVFALIDNPNTGSAANATIRTASDAAQFDIKSHAVARTISRFGQTLGGWNELLGVTASNGIVMGTEGADPMILGTNSTARMTFGASGGVTVTGDFTVTGGTKNFAMVDPADESKAIYYAALEGPEAGTYFRGTAKTVNGKAVITLPGYFSRITENENITVQLTATGKWGQIYVASKSPEQLVIKTEGTEEVEFDYFVQGIRKGYSGFQVERERTFPISEK
jgi:methionine-rich copper-binding protein CopC